MRMKKQARDQLTTLLGATWTCIKDEKVPGRAEQRLTYRWRASREQSPSRGISTWKLVTLELKTLFQVIKRGIQTHETTHVSLQRHDTTWHQRL